MLAENRKCGSNEAFGEPTIAVDTHIFRLSNRTGIAPGETPHVVEKELFATRAGPLEERSTSLDDFAWPIYL